MSRVFVIGAGASVDDGFPVTSDLIAALAHTVKGRSARHSSTHRLYDYLHTVYDVPSEEIGKAAKAWDDFLRTGKRIEQSALPSIIEVLSVLDTVMEDGMSLGPAANPRSPADTRRRNLDPNELRRIRDRVQNALIEQFAALHRRRRPETFRRLVSTLRRDDVVVTTNWDLLLDHALEARFGPARHGWQFGAPQAGIQRKSSASRKPSRQRPLLLKLHGSLNWLWCTQCGGLTIDERAAPVREPGALTTIHTGSDVPVAANSRA